MANSDYNSGKASAVKFFMVLSCIASVVGGIASIARGNLTGGIILLVSLVWTIPMTVSAFRRLNAHEYIGTGFKICTLLFHNLIAGIILLCMSTEGEEEETTTIATDKKLTADTSNKNSSGTVAKPSAPVRTNSPKTTSTQKTTPQNTTSIQKTTPKNTTSLQAKTLATEHTGTYISTKPGVNNTGSSPYTSYTPTKNTSNDFHHWTYFENEYCVRMVFDNFVCGEQDGNVNQVVSKIYNKFAGNINKNSIHMKLSNIRYLLDEKKIRSSLPEGSLWQASSQCRTAFNKVYEEYKKAGKLPQEGYIPSPPPPPTYKIKVILNGEKYFYRHNVNDNANNLIKNEFSYLMATALYKVESKITAEALQKQYPTAIIEIVENVSDKVSIQIRSKRGIITTPRPIPTGPIEDPQPDTTLSTPRNTLFKRFKREAIELFEKKGYAINEDHTTYASKNKTNYTYWANPQFSLLRQNWYLILNDWPNRTLYLFLIPANSISPDELMPRKDKPDIIDLEIYYNDPTFTDSRKKLVSFLKYKVDEMNY